LAAPARAEPTVLRVAAIAPDGTQWARTMKAFARTVETETEGAVHVKYYLGGIAGDEPTALERARKGQLSGAIGALMCEQLAPVLRVLRVPGLVRDRDEGRHLLNVLHPEIAAEMKKNGFVYLGAAGFGLDLPFTRKPVTSLAELRATRFWLREHDEIMRSVLASLGVQLILQPHPAAARLYDEGKVDGFIAPPATALSFQWAGQVRAFTDYKLGYLVACGVLTNTAYDALPTAAKEAVMASAALMGTQFEEVNTQFDTELIGKLFAKKGLKRLEPSPSFRKELDEALAAGRRNIPPALLSPELLARATQILDDYRRKSR
jgi:TRAP-type C4-dicarboxylate transport system substrate-binding protein